MQILIVQVIGKILADKKKLYGLVCMKGNMNILLGYTSHTHRIGFMNQTV